MDTIVGYSAQLISVYHNLATLLDAGVPVVRALTLAGKNAPRGPRKILAALTKAVSEGKTVSEAVDQYPRVFRPFDRALIAAADHSGNLEACFFMLSDWYDFQRRMGRIVLSGALLPVFMLHVGAVVVALPPLILGRIQLPGFGLRVLSILGILYVPVICIMMIRYLGTRIGRLRLILDAAVLQIPIFGAGLRELSIARFCRTFNMLYQAGVPISECFALAPQAAGNHKVAHMFMGGIECIERGEMPSRGFSRRLPAEYRELWMIGEETGELDRCSGKIADMAGDRAELRISESARWFPRLIYLAYVLIMAYMIIQLAQGVYGQMGAF